MSLVPAPQPDAASTAWREGSDSMTTLVFLHILGAAIWAGGLIFVGVVAAGARRTISERERTEFFRFIGNGFLILAGVAALLLGLSGNLLVEDLFGGWDQLSGEASRLIVWKTILFIAVLLLAVVHGVVLGPGIRRLRLRRAAGKITPDEEAALKRRVAISTTSQVLMLAGTVAISCWRQS
jgi:putative copper export protein